MWIFAPSLKPSISGVTIQKPLGQNRHLSELKGEAVTQQGKRPPVDGDEPETDETHPGDVLQLKPLAENNGAKQNSTDRDEEGHEQ
jgi:hypothetical protein